MKYHPTPLPCLILRCSYWVTRSSLKYKLKDPQNKNHSKFFGKFSNNYGMRNISVVRLRWKTLNIFLLRNNATDNTQFQSISLLKRWHSQEKTEKNYNILVLSRNSGTIFFIYFSLYDPAFILNNISFSFMFF